MASTVSAMLPPRAGRTIRWGQIITGGIALLLIAIPIALTPPVLLVEPKVNFRDAFREVILRHLDELSALSVGDLLEKRYAKFRAFGEWRSA